MRFGSMPNDGGHLLLTDEERDRVRADPVADRYVRELLGTDQLMRGTTRWCLWLKDADPEDVRRSPLLRDRVQAVRSYRLASTRPATRRLADVPALFGEIRQPTQRYVLVPRHGSENRRHIPMALSTLR